METLNVGTRIFNRGDMANIEHMGTITEVQVSSYGVNYLIAPDIEGEMSCERASYWIPKVCVSPEYKGDGLTRIVTEESYLTWRNERMKAFLESVGR